MPADPRARSFGAAAADYERGRPGWPERVVEVAGLPPSAEVVDLAAGTGKLTRLLARRFRACRGGRAR
jgi:predicted methyltransferase